MDTQPQPTHSSPVVQSLHHYEFGKWLQGALYTQKAAEHYLKALKLNPRIFPAHFLAGGIMYERFKLCWQSASASLNALRSNIKANIAFLAKEESPEHFMLALKNLQTDGLLASIGCESSYCDSGTGSVKDTVVVSFILNFLLSHPLSRSGEVQQSFRKAGSDAIMEQGVGGYTGSELQGKLKVTNVKLADIGSDTATMSDKELNRSPEAVELVLYNFAAAAISPSLRLSCILNLSVVYSQIGEFDMALLVLWYGLNDPRPCAGMRRHKLIPNFANLLRAVGQKEQAMEVVWRVMECAEKSITGHVDTLEELGITAAICNEHSKFVLEFTTGNVMTQAGQISKYLPYSSKRRIEIFNVLQRKEVITHVAHDAMEMQQVNIPYKAKDDNFNSSEQPKCYDKGIAEDLCKIKE